MRTGFAVAVALAFAAGPVRAVDIVITPPGSGAVTFTNSGGTQTRLRIHDDGTVTMNGNLFKGAEWFLHNFGTNNTFLGLSAGNLSMTGAQNTAVGRNVLLANTTGARNTVLGANALRINTQGEENTALGADALTQNTLGGGNVALGVANLRNNSTGYANLAAGYQVMFNNTEGTFNTALGFAALNANTTGDNNVAIGSNALINNVTGSDNIAIGRNAGYETLGSNNILIGDEGEASDNTTVRLGMRGTHSRTFIAGIRGVSTGGTAIPVVIDSLGQLGTASSSASTKDDIADMNDATGDLMKLRPVTFHYKSDRNPAGRTLQYGLVAEEVEQVYPGLVAHSADGKVETVMYQFLPPMLLNEFQRQQRTIDAQASRIATLEGELAAIKRALGLP